jgi:hypothetical protein
VTCLEVRERLTEHSLGLLAAVDARDVERHVQWCAGCRKELAELQEGAETLALALPPAEPPAWLESRIVGRLMAAAGSNRPPSRSRMRMLVAATLTAVLLALGATGWAIAERGEAQSIRETTAEQIRRAQVLESLLKSLEANPLEANLLPVLDAQGSGRVVIYSSPEEPDFIHASVSLIDPRERAYTIQLRDHSGRILSAGRLGRSDNGIMIFYEFSGKNLSRGTSITVLDAAGRPVMTGTVEAGTEG